MPLYEYRCPGCDKVFEELVSNADTRVACPTCGERKVTRQLSTFNHTGANDLPTSACSAAPDCRREAPPGGCCGGGRGCA